MQINTPEAKGLALLVKISTAIALAIWVGFPAAIRVMVIFMGMDMISGIVAAGMDGKISSQISIRGLFKKISLAMAVLFIHLLDGLLLPLLNFMPEELGLEKIFAIYISFNESISIVENLAHCGVPFPSPIVMALSKIKSKLPRVATQEEIDGLSLVPTKVVEKTVETTEVPKKPPVIITTVKETVVTKEAVVDPGISQIKADIPPTDPQEK